MSAKRTRAVLVGRVSTDQGQDAESQLLALRAVAERQGWEVVEEVKLEGVSAWKDDDARKVREAAMRPIREGRADLLACWALDRLFRGRVEGAFAFLRELEDHLGGRFFSIEEPFLATGSDPQQRELMLSLRAWVARWESERRSERLRLKAASKRHRAEAGGGRATWGRGRMPTLQDVARVRELRAQGRTLREISNEVGLSLGTVWGVVHRRPDERLDVEREDEEEGVEAVGGVGGDDLNEGVYRASVDEGSIEAPSGKPPGRARPRVGRVVDEPGGKGSATPRTSRRASAGRTGRRP